MLSASYLALLLASVGVVYASPTTTHVLHEKRSVAHTGWDKLDRVSPDFVLPIRIGLRQQNLNRGDAWLHDVSDPASSNYGKHWSPEDVRNAFKPSSNTVQAVRDWLEAEGFAAQRAKLSNSGGWLAINATVAEAERLLKTSYHFFEHQDTGTPHIACDEYSLPAHIQQDHVDFVTPTVHFDAKVRPTEHGPRHRKRQTHAVKPGTGTSVGTNSANFPKFGGVVNVFNSLISQLENCDKVITPNCLRALYEFPPGITNNTKNSYGIVEYTPEAYLQSDLNLFFKNFSSAQVGQSPKELDIDGGYQQTQAQGFGFNAEPDLDLEYAMALVYPQQVTLYQVGDLQEGASFNNFLDALDASYCTFQGGDDPSQDGIYPDPAPGGYKGPENCGGLAATKVISTSYSYNEADLTPFYAMRQCTEYMKLGLLGTTVLYSSGDYGVAGNGGQCLNPDGTYNNGGSGRFNPSFPGTCPYVLSVGATQVKNNTNIVTALATGTQPEEACETVIYSGGGFSNVFPLPAYQSAAVKGFFANHPPPYGADRYNNSMRTRALPDVSANGANYIIAVDGKFALVYGTSASSPVFGSILTLINEARYNLGKGSIGFINPTLYAHPSVLNDITQGGNQGCGTPGFTATTGWDPVTGLGTPNFPKMLALFLALP